MSQPNKIDEFDWMPDFIAKTVLITVLNKLGILKKDTYDEAVERLLKPSS